MICDNCSIKLEEAFKFIEQIRKLEENFFVAARNQNLKVEEVKNIGDKEETIAMQIGNTTVTKINKPNSIKDNQRVSGFSLRNLTVNIEPLEMEAVYLPSTSAAGMVEAIMDHGTENNDDDVRFVGTHASQRKSTQFEQNRRSDSTVMQLRKIVKTEKRESVSDIQNGSSELNFLILNRIIRYQT